MDNKIEKVMLYPVILFILMIPSAVFPQAKTIDEILDRGKNKQVEVNKKEITKRREMSDHILRKGDIISTGTTRVNSFRTEHSFVVSYNSKIWGCTVVIGENARYTYAFCSPNNPEN